MTEAKFTAGTWVASVQWEEHIFPKCDNFNRVCWITSRTEERALPLIEAKFSFKLGRDECLANAHLMTAAPELYEATEPFDAWFAHHIADAPEWNENDTVKVHISIGELRAIKAARAKARGES